MCRGFTALFFVEPRRATTRERSTLSHVPSERRRGLLPFQLRFLCRLNRVRLRLAAFIGLICVAAIPMARAADATEHDPVPVVPVASTSVTLPVTEVTGSRFSRLSTLDGLSQTRVAQIVQDDRGFMWFGTQYGLNRYDGYEFRLYVHDPENLDSLSSAYIFSLFKDRSGNLWIGCNQVLDRFDPRTEHFTHYHIAGAAGSGMGDTVVHISQDHDGMLWLATGNGLHRLNPDNGEITHFRHDAGDPRTLSTNDINWSGEDRERRLWVGNANYMAEFDRQQGKVVRRIAVADPQQTAFFEDRDGKFWIVHASGTGLARYDQQNNVVIPYTFSTHNPPADGKTGIMGVVEDDAGNLWLGSFGIGLLKLDPQRRSVQWLRNHPQDAHSIGEDKVISLFRDRDGGIWSGLHSSGVARLSPRSIPFEVFKHDPADPNSLTVTFVNALLVTSDGTLWIGNDDGINRIDRTSGKRTLVPAGLSGNPMVISLAEDREGCIWLGTNSDGLRSVDPRSGSYRSYRHTESNPSSLSNDRVHRIFVDHLGTVWVGTDDGLDRFDRQTGNFRTYKVQEWSHRSQNYVSIAEDSSGRLWLGTAQTGLHRFDPNTGEFRIYRSDLRNPGGLRDDTVPNVYVDKADVVWAATQSGLNRLDPKTNRFEAFDTRNGLPGNSISCIREDTHGNLWISTNNGISRFDPKARTFENYSESDGLPGNDLTGWDTCTTSKDGELFFGGFEGGVGFYPERLTQTRPPTPVVLTELDIGGVRELVGPDRVLKQAIAYSRSITLAHTQTQFSLSFAGLRYDNPASTRYRYRLLGFNSTWNEVNGRNRRATYTSLPAGTYSFQVQASSQFGQWSEPGESLGIRILPPWWSTWWFRAMYISAAISVLWAIYRWRITQVSRQMTTRMEERIRERTRIAQDLHDTLLQGLLSASMQLGVAKNKLDEHSSAKALVERVFSMIGQMIWESRNVVSGLRIRRAQCQELEADIAKIPTEIPLSSDAEFKVLVEGTPKPMRVAAREELYWIARESITNAFRHSKATQIEVLLEYGSQHFRLIVRDNGVGMDSPDVGAGNGHWGLSGMAERADRIGGKIRIASRKGAGTEVDVQVQRRAAYEGKRERAAALTEEADV